MLVSHCSTISQLYLVSRAHHEIFPRKNKPYRPGRDEKLTKQLLAIANRWENAIRFSRIPAEFTKDLRHELMILRRDAKDPHKWGVQGDEDLQFLEEAIKLLWREAFQAYQKRRVEEKEKKERQRQLAAT